MRKKISTLASMLFLVALSVAVLAVYWSRPVTAASGTDISGTVKDKDGKGLRGAVVTVTAGYKRISRLTDDNGRYMIGGLASGSYKVSAAAWGFEQKEDSKNLSGKVEMSFALAPQWNPNRLSSAEWLAALPQNDETREMEFRCTGCHNISNLVIHKGSPGKAWQPIVANMGRNVLNDGEMAGARERSLQMISFFDKYFGPASPAPAREQLKPPEISNAVLNATIREYDVPGFTYVHSLSVDPGTGRVYFTEIDKATNAIGEFDIKTEEFSQHKFASEFSQPHNSIVAPDGKVWVSLNNAKTVGMFDPKTGKASEFPAVAIGHTIDIDWKGNIWESGGSGVFKYDPQTGKSQLYPLPRPQPDGESNANCGTYDLAVGMKNDIWFTCGGNSIGYIGKVDSETGKVKMYPVPNSRGMKGIAVDRDGNVWFSSFSDHKLGRLDAKTEEIKLYQPPTLHAGPYGITVDRYNSYI